MSYSNRIAGTIANKSTTGPLISALDAIPKTYGAVQLQSGKVLARNKVLERALSRRVAVGRAKFFAVKKHRTTPDRWWEHQTRGRRPWAVPTRSLVDARWSHAALDAFLHPTTRAHFNKTFKSLQNTHEHQDIFRKNLRKSIQFLFGIIARGIKIYETYMY